MVVTPPANQTWKKYYYLGGRRIALRIVRNGQADEVNYLHGDHLGSTRLTTNASGAVVAQAKYYPYGGIRWESGTTPTDYRFTGQRQDANIGLYDYGARFYDPLIGRFVSADSIVPGAGNPQALNRFAYALSNPVKYTDPSGHRTKGPVFLCEPVCIPSGWGSGGRPPFDPNYIPKEPLCVYNCHDDLALTVAGLALGMATQGGKLGEGLEPQVNPAYAGSDINPYFHLDWSRRGSRATETEITPGFLKRENGSTTR